MREKPSRLSHTDIGWIFRRQFNGRTNFVTPHVEGYGKKRHLIWEISSGPAMLSGGTLYGVTVMEVTRDDSQSYGWRSEPRYDLSQAVHSRSSLRNLLLHIRSVARAEHEDRKEKPGTGPGSQP